MTAQVRSVVVRLEAMVAKYIRDINRAGDATEKAFDRVHASTTKTREEFVATDRAAANLAQSTDKLNTTTKVTSPSQRQLATDVDRVSVAAVRGSSSIDQYSGRLRILSELVATLGPGLLPLGAGGLTAIAALAGLFGGATVGALGLVVAVQGVGDALKAVEKARLDPTVENLRAAEEAVDGLAPNAQKFVARFQEIRPTLKALRDAGAQQFFPGLTESLDSLDRLAPTLQKLLAASGRAGGDAIAAGAESLTTERWAPFLEFLTDEIPDAVEDATQLLGSLSHAGAELWMALDPTNDRFIDWLRDVTDGLDDWAGSAQGREDIRDFLGYVEETGPKVADFVVSSADAFTQLVQAAAPLSGPVLESVTALANIVADVADSDLGTPLLAGVAALTLYSRGLQVAVALQSKLYGTDANKRFQAQGAFGFTRGLAKDVKASTPSLREFGQVAAFMGQSSANASEKTLAARASVRSFAAQAARGAAPIAGLAIATTGLADGVGLSNTAGLALAGSFAGPVGAALGGAAGLFLDITSSSSSSAASIRDMQDAIDSVDIDAMNAAVDDFNTKFAKYLDGDDTFGDGVSFLMKSVLSGGGFSEEYNKGKDLIAARDKAVRDAAEAQAAYNSVVATGGRVAFEAKYGIDALVTSMQQQQAVARSALSNQFAWGQAVQDIRGLLKEGSRGFNEFTEAGQNNFHAISSAAEALNKMVEAGELTNSEYVDLRDQFVQFARQLGASRVEAEGFANQLLDFPDTLAPQIAVQFDKQQLIEAKAAFDSLPPEVRTTISADGIPQTEGAVDALVRKYKLSEKARRALITLKDMASPRIQQILAKLREVKDRRVTVTTTWQNIYAPPKNNPSRSSPGLGLLAPGALGKADGGTVPGQRSPYGDKTLILAAPGEEIITNRHGEADRFRADRAAGRIPAYADGGTVQGYAGGGTVLRSSGDREAEHVARGLRNMRQELAAATKVLAKETKQRSSLLDRRDTLRGGIRSGLDRGIWRPGDTDAWSSDGDPVAYLRRQIADIDKFDALTGRLKKKVGHGALEAILEEGNLADLQAYDSMSKADLAEYSRLYGVVQRKLTATSTRGADAVYAAPIQANTAKIGEVVREMKEIRKDMKVATKAANARAARNRAANRKGAAAAAGKKHRGYLS